MVRFWGISDNSAMRRIEVKQLDYYLTPVGGLALVGHYLKALAPQWAGLDRVLPVRGGVSNSDMLRSYLGRLVQGKSDFDAVENYRGDKLFKEALGIGLLPSSPTLRQRLDRQAAALFEHVPGMIEGLLRSQRPDYGVLPCGWVPLDADTFAMDNGGTRKEGVGRTYAEVDGNSPLAAHPGAHGSCVELSLRPGVQHSARETDFKLERVIPMAQRLSAAGPRAPILARLDSGFDTAALLARLDAEPGTQWQKPRQGKRVAVWEEVIQIEGTRRPLCRVLRLVERDIDRRGQQLIVPEIELQGWTISLPPEQFTADKIIALYADHGTHEQFHSKFKTDLDLERLPSGKFDTNYLVGQLAALAMNVLHLMGQHGLLGPDAPVRHPAIYGVRFCKHTLQSMGSGLQVYRVYVSCSPCSPEGQVLQSRTLD